MIIDPQELDRGGRNALINGLVMPRPIAWVSSRAPDGARNLAPFSFFGAFSFDPPTIGLGPGSRKGVNKDSLANVRASGEFVVNLVSRELAEAANRSAAEFAPDVDEWDVAGVTAVPAEVVKPERVQEAPAALECRVLQVVELGSAEARSNSLVIASVVSVYVRDDVWNGKRTDPGALDLVARMGAHDWCTTRDRFELKRPDSTDPDEVRAG